MDSVYRSLAIPALLSALSLTATLTYYTRWQRLNAEAPPGGAQVGYLRSATRQVERRAKNRVIWSQLDAGAPVYTGDSVRTPALAEGDVQLVQGNTIITLEPDSLVVLDESKGQLELNLVSGSLQVERKAEAPAAGKADGKAVTARGPVIKAGGTRVELNKAGTQLALTKAEGREASIAVVKGAAAVESGNRRVEVQQGKVGTVSAAGVTLETALQVVAPRDNALIVVNDLPDRRLAVRFPPLAAGHTVTLETGASRTALAPAGAPVPGPSGAVSLPVEPGTVFYRLVARNAAGVQTGASPPQRLDAIWLEPPALHLPAANAAIVPAPGETLTLTFTVPPRASTATLEVGRSAAMSPVIWSKVLDPRAPGASVTMAMPAEGAYWWRLRAGFDSGIPPLASEVRRFDVRRVLTLAAPAPLGPDQDQTVLDSTLDQRGQAFTWQPVEGAAAYDFELQRGDRIVVKDSVPVSARRVKDLTPGSYQWRVRATSPRAEASAWSAPRRLTVTTAAPLTWITSGQEIQRYTGNRPVASLAWQAAPGVSAYRLRSGATPDRLASAAWIRVAAPAAKVNHKSEGVYHYEVQGLDTAGRVVALSRPLRLEVRPVPELPAPQILGSEAGGGRLKADRAGNLALQWRPVEGATGYEVRLTGEGGKSPQERRVQGDSLRFTGLMPGSYRVTIRTLGTDGRPGPVSKAVTVVVPATSDVPPPAALEIKVH